MKIAKGINVTKNTIKPLANSLYKKEDNIATSVLLIKEKVEKIVFN
jgi:hypothetical protein